MTEVIWREDMKEGDKACVKHGEEQPKHTDSQPKRAYKSRQLDIGIKV